MLCTLIECSINTPRCLSQDFTHSLCPIVFVVGSVKHIVQCCKIEHDWSLLLHWNVWSYPNVWVPVRSVREYLPNCRRKNDFCVVFCLYKVKRSYWHLWLMREYGLRHQKQSVPRCRVSALAVAVLTAVNLVRLKAPQLQLCTLHLRQDLTRHIASTLRTCSPPQVHRK